MVCLWAQEILGYYFTIVHIINKMMVYVDDLTWRFWHLISHHISISELLRSCERAKHPCAYATTKFSNLSNAKITETDNPFSKPPPLLTSYALQLFYQNRTTNSATSYSLDPSSSPSTTTLPIYIRPYPNLCKILPLHDAVIPNTAMTALQIHQSLEIQCLCINDVVCFYTNWGRLHGNGPVSWSLQNLFTSPTPSSIFNILHP